MPCSLCDDFDESPDGPFLLFAGPDYEVTGGWTDFIRRFSTLEEALQEARTHYSDQFSWWHIVHNDKIVEQWADSP